MKKDIQVEWLLKLCGMKYHWGKYTPEQWEAKTGVNPHWLGPLIHISAGSHLCCWTDEAEAIVQRHFSQTRANWHALGIPA